MNTDCPLRLSLIATAIALAASAAVAQEDFVLDGHNETQYLDGQQQFRDFRILNGATLRINDNYTGTGFLTIQCTRLVIDASSSIDGTGQGESRKGGADLPLEAMGGNGGSYGGRGGVAAHHLLRQTYGTIKGLEIEAGGIGARGADVHSPSGEFVSGALGSEGGAALKIIADEVVIEGHINMDGKVGEKALTCSPRTPCGNATGGGGGAGGGILIVARHLILGPSAQLSANGGDGGLAGSCEFSGFGGGGGRVKIFYENGHVTPDSNISVREGKSYPALCVNPPPIGLHAEPGTIWIQQVPSVDQLLNPKADLNNDGIVDQSDLLLLLEQWHQTEPTPAPTPEPTPESAPEAAIGGEQP